MPEQIRVLDSPYFNRGLKKLIKRYHHILDDLEPLTDQLRQGETPGDRLDNLKPYVVYKVRVPNRDAQRGKCGGYRVVYYVRTAYSIYLLAIYSKSDQPDIADEVLRSVVDEIEADISSDSE